MSKSISLFGISQEYQTLYQMANNLEVNENGEIIDNEEVLKSLLDEIEATFTDKLDSCEYIRKEINSNVLTLAAEIKRLQSRKKALDNRSSKLKDLMQDVMLVSGETKLKGKHNFSLGTRKTLLIKDNLTPEFFNQNYVRVTKEFDKRKITEDLKNGVEIEGALMTEKVSFSIR